MSSLDGIIQCPDAGGLDNDPSRFLNRVDRNCVPYTVPELILFAGGCLLWVVAYAILIRNMRKDRFCEMSAVAGCSNFAWEFIWSFVVFTDMGWFMRWTYRAWFFLDIFIFWLMLKVGGAQVQDGFLRRHFKAACVLGTAFFLVAYHFFVKEGHDTLIGANSAYIAQMLVSVFCLLMLLRAPTAAGFSWHIGWMRSLGTGMNTVFMLMHYPGNHFLHTLALTSLVLDAGYLVLLRKKMAAAPAAA